MKKEALFNVLAIAMILASVFAVLFAEVSNLRQEINDIELLKGDTGDKGATGEHGLPGINGTDGQKGDKGDKGDRGTTGNSGRSGTNGQDGQDGQDGINGTNGIAGINGTDGFDGQDGINGTNGLEPIVIIGSNEVLFLFEDNYYAYFATSPNALKSMLYRVRENVHYITGDSIHFKIINSVIVYL